MDDLEKLLDEAEGMARDSIRETGAAAPMVLCETVTGERFIISYEPAPSAIQRRVQALGIGGVMRSKDVVRYVVIGEVWLAMAVPGEPLPVVPPRMSPDRTEAVFLEGHDYADERVRALHIDREGGQVRLTPEAGVTGFSAGTWSGLLAEPASPPAPTVH